MKRITLFTAQLIVTPLVLLLGGVAIYLFIPVIFPFTVWEGWKNAWRELKRKEPS